MSGITVTISPQGTITVPRQALRQLGIDHREQALLEIYADVEQTEETTEPVIVLRRYHPRCASCKEKLIDGKTVELQEHGFRICADCLDELNQRKETND